MVPGVRVEYSADEYWTLNEVCKPQKSCFQEPADTEKETMKLSVHRKQISLFD